MPNDYQFTATHSDGRKVGWDGMKWVPMLRSAADAATGGGVSSSLRVGKNLVGQLSDPKQRGEILRGAVLGMAGTGEFGEGMSLLPEKMGTQSAPKDPKAGTMKVGGEGKAASNFQHVDENLDNYLNPHETQYLTESEKQAFMDNWNKWSEYMDKAVELRKQNPIAFDRARDAAWPDSRRAPNDIYGQHFRDIQKLNDVEEALIQQNHSRWSENNGDKNRFEIFERTGGSDEKPKYDKNSPLFGTNNSELAEQIGGDLSRLHDREGTVRIDHASGQVDAHVYDPSDEIVSRYRLIHKGKFLGGFDSPREARQLAERLNLPKGSFTIKVNTGMEE